VRRVKELLNIRRNIYKIYIVGSGHDENFVIHQYPMIVYVRNEVNQIILKEKAKK